MTLIATTLASGPGWTASEVVCSAGPTDRSFEEQHTHVAVAVVLRGTFQYRSSRGTAMLVPGAVLLGNPGDGFECSHQHSIGDRCLAFHFDPAFHENLIAGVRNVTRSRFECASLAPRQTDPALLACADHGVEAPQRLEELAHELVACVALAGTGHRGASFRTGRMAPRGAARVHDLVHWMEASPQVSPSLAELAQRASLSPCHLLREFKRVTGTTPYQFSLALRMRQAARSLRQGNSSVLDVALDAGFNDASDFNRRFRQMFGMTPSNYRRASDARTAALPY